MRSRSILAAATVACLLSPAFSHAADPAKAKDAAKAKDTAKPKEAAVSAEARAAGADAFLRVYKVLQSPRCRNCHPAGDAPLQKDDGRPHAQFISRKSESVGLTCGACHNEAPLPGAKMPPGAPNWDLPPSENPMVFEGKTPAGLCTQLKSGDMTLKELLHHVETDALVLYGWNPGEGRTVPPLTHAEFVEAFRAWVAASAPCPL